jgi:hypothetical protein
MTDAESFLVPVCALCRDPIGAEMRVTVLPPSFFRRYLELAGRSMVVDEDDPVVDCRGDLSGGDRAGKRRAERHVGLSRRCAGRRARDGPRGGDAESLRRHLAARDGAPQSAQRQKRRPNPCGADAGTGDTLDGVSSAFMIPAAGAIHPAVLLLADGDHAWFVTASHGVT